MKLFLIAAAMLLAAALPATAQASSPAALQPLVRGDAAGTVGWLSGNQDKVPNENSNDWYNTGLYGGVQLGWHWTEHHKAQIEAGITNAIDFRTYGPVYVDAIPNWRASEFTFSLRRVAIGEHYQFFRNAWVHPHVGAGVDLTWERSIERADPVTGYDPVTRGSRLIRPGATFGPTTTLRVRPYVETGFKAYMSPRAFFRGDARVLLRDGLEEVLLRCGFGVDF